MSPREVRKSHWEAGRDKGRLLESVVLAAWIVLMIAVGAVACWIAVTG